ncbi:MAG: hypothetical protein O9340_15710 [Cyclobacteriaceae bacterium]|nr:hypothetical protein [Cyclobacteriaceae bacterium]
MKDNKILSTRKVHSNGITITGLFNVQKLKGIQFESIREESFLKLAEMDVSVTKVVDQPVKIHLDDFNYTPDFYLEFNNRRPAYVEIKTAEYLKKLIKFHQSKVDQIKNWCQLRNIDFYIIPIDKIPEPIIVNTFFLSGYKEKIVENSIKQLILKKIVKKKSFNQKQLIESISTENCIDKRTLLVQLWSLASSDEVLVDMRSNMNIFTKVKSKQKDKSNFLKFPYYI